MIRTIRLVTAAMLVVGIAGLLPRLASAQPGGHPFITSVHADFDLFRLRIVGERFGTSPTVWLGETQLDVESATDTEISALLGGPIDPGSYLITVASDDKGKGTAKYLFSAFNATIGAEGPKGEKGDKGDQGVPGNDGADGADGEDGNDGASPFRLVGNNAVYTNGNVGVATEGPSALIQAGPGQNFGQTTTIGASQRPQDTVGVSVRSDFMRPTFQFCASGPCNYIQMDRSSTDLWFGDFNNPSMILQPLVRGGNVGVGVRTPSAQLQVGDPLGHPNTFGNITTVGIWQQQNDSVGLSIRRSNGNPIQQFCNFDCNYIEMDGATNLLFGTNGNSVNPTMSVRRTVQGGGVGIHMTPQGGVALAVNGLVMAQQYGQFSSRRFKSNIETLGGALDLVERMRGVTYTSKSTGKAEVGLIAEEVYEVLPQVVAVTDGQVQGIEYSRLVAVLIEAVKEQQAQIAALRQEVTALVAAAAASQK